MNKRMLEVKNFACLRNGKFLFKNLNFTVFPGQLLLLQGANGAGKSTLLRMLAGLRMPEKGMLYWQRQPVEQNEVNYSSNVSYLSHKSGLGNQLTLLENLQHALILGGEKVETFKIEKIMRQFGLIPFAQRLCAELSAGTCRKTSLAATILRQKKIWLLDEPYTALDRRSRAILTRALYFHRKQGGIIIMTSHEPCSYADQHIYLAGEVGC